MRLAVDAAGDRFLDCIHPIGKVITQTTHHVACFCQRIIDEVASRDRGADPVIIVETLTIEGEGRPLPLTLVLRAVAEILID